MEKINKLEKEKVRIKTPAEPNNFARLQQHAVL